MATSPWDLTADEARSELEALFKECFHDYDWSKAVILETGLN